MRNRRPRPAFFRFHVGNTTRLGIGGRPVFLSPINLGKVVHRPTFELDRENEVWPINGKTFDVSNLTVSPGRGTAEIWTLKSKGS